MEEIIPCDPFLPKSKSVKHPRRQKTRLLLCHKKHTYSSPQTHSLHVGLSGQFHLINDCVCANMSGIHLHYERAEAETLVSLRVERAKEGRAHPCTH